MLLPKDEAAGDFDWGSSPALFNIPGGNGSLVAATAKGGILYAANQSDLSLVSKTQLAIPDGVWKSRQATGYFYNRPRVTNLRHK